MDQKAKKFEDTERGEMHDGKSGLIIPTYMYNKLGALKKEVPVWRGPMVCRHKPRLVERTEADIDLSSVRILWVANEHCWFEHRNLRLLMQGVYGVPKEHDIVKNGKDRYYAMLDVNRCMYLTSIAHAEKLASPGGSYFQTQLLDLCMITPEESFSDRRKKAMQRDLDEFEEQMKRNKNFDSGLSIEEQRKALVYAML